MISDACFDVFPTLESERLVFRELDKNDAADIRLIRSNDQVMTYMDSERHLSVQDSEKFILENNEIFKRREGVSWAVIEKSSNEFIGDFAYWRIIKKHSRGEIGYTLKPQFWGKGYMTETMKALIKFGFNDLKLHSIEANINPENEKSRKVLTKMGFRKEAYFRENFLFDGKYLDSEIYSLLERDFSPCGL